jgi:hypothetical protein
MPNFNRVRGHIYKVRFSVKEQEAIDREIMLELADFDRKNENEIDALILWLLHEKFGFGVKRLRRFYELFSAEFDALEKRYELEKADNAWLCTHKLKEYGVDIEKWNKEEEKNDSQK